MIASAAAAAAAGTTGISYLHTENGGKLILFACKTSTAAAAVGEMPSSRAGRMYLWLYFRKVLQGRTRTRGIAKTRTNARQLYTGSYVPGRVFHVEFRRFYGSLFFFVIFTPPSHRRHSSCNRFTGFYTSSQLSRIIIILWKPTCP